MTCPPTSRPSSSILWPARAGACFLLLAAVTARADLGPVRGWLTTGDQSSLLREQAPVDWGTASVNAPYRVVIDPDTTYQTIQGFGAAMTDASAQLLMSNLTEQQRNALMNELFSTSEGIGLSYLRLPMGASDFSTSHYTYNDLQPGQTDPTQTHFSLEPDLEHRIPALQQAKSINPNLKLMGSPWSAPAWMKTNNSLYGGSLKSSSYEAYAAYFRRFVEGYSGYGLAIDAVTVQNEPLHTTPSYPSMLMPTYQQSTFIGDHLGPLFESSGINTKILAYDHNWDEWNYALTVLNDPEASGYIDGTAFHGYAGSVENQSRLHDFKPDKGIYFTEITGGDFAPDFGDSLIWAFENIIVGGLRNWSQTILYWNLALDENRGPHLGGCSNCRGVVTIDRQSGEITREVEYYVLAQVSQFIDPGAVRIDSTTFDGVVETVAFVNPDASEVLIAYNPTWQEQHFEVERAGARFDYTIEARSALTLTWNTRVIPGDLDASGTVDADDIDLLFENLGTETSLYDLSHDGIVNHADVDMLIRDILNTEYGDANLDGRVDLLDLSLLAQSFETRGGWASGDFSGNTVVNLLDLSTLASYFNHDSSRIPEPAPGVLICLLSSLAPRARRSPSLTWSTAQPVQIVGHGQLSS
ncbi:glycoside hydrolase family 30 beta sandwich domain-containing protein [Mucisphaera calidilacus]|uniref:O-Glycosyl hydrolase family 30 n=1 Tax=Mucisphaera calidilacus TaxID=2527982 RepID=A0A518BVL1_9BACT|nr:glycoside hydrolase family 30 beta sandwich domain-containing protein [Mucisphaera calidilacus]QDU71020.1 O-Glycosyl hydrolase family 30 [Mucisphaera calidilacus]